MELNPFDSSQDSQPYRTSHHCRSCKKHFVHYQTLINDPYVFLSSPDNFSIDRESAAACSLA